MIFLVFFSSDCAALLSAPMKCMKCMKSLRSARKSSNKKRTHKLKDLDTAKQDDVFTASCLADRLCKC